MVCSCSTPSSSCTCESALLFHALSTLCHAPIQRVWLTSYVQHPDTPVSIVAGRVHSSPPVCTGLRHPCNIARRQTTTTCFDCGRRRRAARHEELLQEVGGQSLDIWNGVSSSIVCRRGGCQEREEPEGHWP